MSKSTPPPPPPRWAKPPFTKQSLSPKSETLAFSPINKASNGNITVTTTVTFSVNNTQIHNHQINESIQSDRLQLTLASNAINNNSCADHVFSPIDTTTTFAEPNEESQVRITINIEHDFIICVCLCDHEKHVSHFNCMSITIVLNINILT